MLTKLDVINAALAAVGLKPALSLDTQHPTVVKALAAYNRAYLRFLSKGWYFNEYCRTFTPNTAGEIIVPTCAITINFDSEYYTVRNTRVMDTRTGLFVFTGPVTGKIIEYIDLPDVPAIARTYFSDLFTYLFFLDENGGEPKLSNYRNNATISEAVLSAEDMKHKNVNFFERTDSDVTAVAAGRRIR